MGGGLGLAITKAIVEAHDGSIDVTSKNRTTSFVIVFPREGSINKYTD